MHASIHSARFVPPDSPGATRRRQTDTAAVDGPEHYGRRAEEDAALPLRAALCRRCQTWIAQTGNSAGSARTSMLVTY
jgi:hypothetical protein